MQPNRVALLCAAAIIFAVGMSTWLILRSLGALDADVVGVISAVEALRR